jgi:hypothetical protein
MEMLKKQKKGSTAEELQQAVYKIRGRRGCENKKRFKVLLLLV